MDLVIMMTPGASVLFVESDFDDFLYASIGAERNEMPLSVLSALVRLNVDPWREAAELSELPKHTATQRLTSLIARLPMGRWTHADCGVIADRLILLLPHPGASNAPLAPKAPAPPKRTPSAMATILICAVLTATALIVAASREPSSRVVHDDVPAFSTALPSPPQSR
jgi:hypothetical protein